MEKKKIQISEREYNKMLHCFRDRVLLDCIILVTLSVVCAAILIVSQLGLSATASFIYNLFIIFVCSLVYLAAFIIRTIYNLILTSRIRRGLFKVCSSNRVRRFVNVKFRKKEVASTTYVSCLFSRYCLSIK